MLASQIPPKFPVPFASSAVGGDIRAIPTTSVDPNAASLTAGFPANTFTPISGGGSPPDGRDFNGLFLQITQWSQWQGAGNPAPGYDAAFSASIGGYPAGAMLSAAGVIGYFWLSLVDSNVSNPDAGGAGWQSFSLQSPFTTGDVKPTYKVAADPGWLLMDDGSIGSVTSGANHASVVYQALFTLFFSNITDTYAPLQTSVGGATTRAAQGTAAAAWAANCRMGLPAVLGRALSGAGAGATLTSRALGQTVGEETHLLTTGEMPVHNHGITEPNGGLGHQHPNGQVVAGTSHLGNQPGADLGATGFSVTGITINNAGGGGAHNNMQPSAFMNVMVKL